jgi:leader peptidase (prepilin peptidase)/N-methyltransferase
VWEFLVPDFFRDAVTLLLLLLISIRDLQKGIIPNSLVLLLFFWVFLWQLVSPDLPHGLSLAGFLAGGGFFYLIAFLSKGGLGGGDIKLMAVLGMAAGWPFVLLVFLLAFVSGAVAGLILLLIKRKTWRATLPFAPFLSLAFFLTSFWGQMIWQWYTSFL